MKTTRYRITVWADWDDYTSPKSGIEYGKPDQEDVESAIADSLYGSQDRGLPGWGIAKVGAIEMPPRDHGPGCDGAYNCTCPEATA